MAWSPGAAGDADGPEVRRVERGEHGDGEQGEPGGFALGARGCALEHLGSTGRVNREVARPEPARARHGTLDGLGNVVELQIQEHRSELAQTPNRRRPLAHEELEADLEDTRRLGDERGAALRFSQRGVVEREGEPFPPGGSIHGLSMDQSRHANKREDRSSR